MPGKVEPHSLASTRLMSGLLLSAMCPTGTKTKAPWSGPCVGGTLTFNISRMRLGVVFQTENKVAVVRKHSDVVCG